MARSLTFQCMEAQFSAQLVKLERSHLYGTVRLRTLDRENRPCSLATLGSDGNTLIPRGGTALGYLNTLGEWIPRQQLNAVSLEGDALEEVPSSFDGPVDLDSAERTSAIDFLDHSVRLCYQLEVREDIPEALMDELRAGAIIRFGFSYRGGLDTDPAFIFSDTDAVLWMLVTSVNQVEYVSLEQAALCMGEEMMDEIDNDDEDNLDFGML